MWVDILIDILMALAFALLIEYFAFMSKRLKQFIVFVSCITFIFVYFISGRQMNFIGEIDFGIWIMFIIIFNQFYSIAIDKLKNNNKG